MDDIYVERKICIGFITSTEYLQQTRDFWDPRWMESETAQLLTSWCVEYFDKYNKAPGKDIEGIYTEKLREGLSADKGEWIEEILSSLSEEHDQTGVDTYQTDLAKKYFQERHLKLLVDDAGYELEKGNTTLAEEMLSGFTPLISDDTSTIDPFSSRVRERVQKAFAEREQPLVKYPKALGQFWNAELIRGGFVAIMGAEKRGKCLPGDQKILLADGTYKTLLQVIQEKRKDVVCFNEKLEKFVPGTISEYWENGEKETFQVTTRTGRKVTVTGNHPFLTPNGWKDLTVLKPGCFIAVPKRLNIFGSEDLPEHVIRLLAYFITEGCLREYKEKDGVTTHVGFTTADPDIKQDFERCVALLNCQVKWNGIDGRIVNSEQNRGKHNKNYVLEMVKKYGLWNKLSYDKTIPEQVFRLPKAKLRVFLQVLFTCDGWVNNTTGTDKQIGFSVANEILARQVHALLIRFGVVAKLAYSPNDKHGAWVVSIGDSENLLRFCTDEGEVELGGCNRSEVLWDEITSITAKGVQPTFDLTVEKYHNFIAEDILVHNTFILIDLAMRGIRSGNKVAFFQAGDMTELQQLRRFGIYLASRSDQERYCGALWVPTADCLYHQLDTCDRDQREENTEQIFDKPEDITYEGLLSAAGQYPDHKPCYNCRYMKGSPWLEQRPAVQPLTWTEAYKSLRRFGRKYNASFRMSTHANETLSVSGIKAYLSTWEKREGFVPDIVLIDYADILAPDADIARLDFRHQQNRTWQRLRRLSEERNCLVMTATQIKAAGYQKNLLTLDDFSEDKRKYAHVTAMYGLNQTPEEKRIGLMRINELVVRESDFDSQRPVTVLQRLQMGRPVLGSYW